MQATGIKTLGDYLYWAEQRFIDAELYFGHGTDNAWDEALMIALPTLQLPPDTDQTQLERNLSESELNTLLILTEQRITTHKPAAYLTKTAYFCGLTFYVDERVLIPRSPIAELITKRFSPWKKEDNTHRVLDLCTGSACLAIACAYAFSTAMIAAIDVSADALNVAKRNVKQHQLQNRVALIESDLFSAVPDEKYDIIISNPPYVSTEELANLPAEYSHEPQLGFAGGDDGLDIVLKIIAQAKNHLAENGILIVEVGNSQAALEKRCPEMSFVWLEFEHGGHGVFLMSDAP